MIIVAGINLSNLQPKIWDNNSPYFILGLKAVMISYSDFGNFPKRREMAMNEGLHSYLGIPSDIKIYLDNGAFYFLQKEKGEVSRKEYEEFVIKARPDWYPIPQDYIPSPKMSDEDQLSCLRRTMEVNQEYRQDGFVPVIHICRYMDQYLQQFQGDADLIAKKVIGLGGIVPNLLRASKAMAYQDVLVMVQKVRLQLRDHNIHIFGIGGTATLHLAALLQVDSVDSSGWRNRAARGIIQLPGKGDRTVASLGNWRGRKLDEGELAILKECLCPACQNYGIDGLKTDKLAGFCNRATHNLWTLLEEEKLISYHMKQGDYVSWCNEHIENTTYKPLITYLLNNAKTFPS